MGNERKENQKRSGTRLDRRIQKKREKRINYDFVNNKRRNLLTLWSHNGTLITYDGQKNNVYIIDICF